MTSLGEAGGEGCCGYAQQLTQRKLTIPVRRYTAKMVDQKRKNDNGGT